MRTGVNTPFLKLIGSPVYLDGSTNFKSLSTYGGIIPGSLNAVTMKK